jgi:uncharacterized protein YndB with AHSA1/START domain
MAEARPVGLTRDAGWEIGVSRTVPHALDEVWRLLTSDEGLALWLGEGARLDPVRGSRYATADGTEGEVRGYRERDRIRLTWRPPNWTHDSTLQVAVTPARRGTTLRFHQERLADAGERERQRERWRSVIGRLERALDARGEGPAAERA